MEFTASDGTKVPVWVFPSLGGNLFVLFRAKVAIADQGSKTANLALARAAWKSARKSTKIPRK